MEFKEDNFDVPETLEEALNQLLPKDQGIFLIKTEGPQVESEGNTISIEVEEFEIYWKRGGDTLMILSSKPATEEEIDAFENPKIGTPIIIKTGE